MTKAPGGAAPVGKLRTYLLAWTLGPIALFLLMDAVSLYRSTQRVTAQVHDRLLEATARQIGDRIHVERNELSIHVPLAMVEAIEGSSGSRMYYRVLGFDGQQVAGDSGLLPPPRGLLMRVHRCRPITPPQWAVSRCRPWPCCSPSRCRKAVGW